MCQDRCLGGWLGKQKSCYVCSKSWSKKETICVSQDLLARRTVAAAAAAESSSSASGYSLFMPQLIQTPLKPASQQRQQQQQ